MLRLDVHQTVEPSDVYGSYVVYFWSLNSSNLHASPDRDLAPPNSYTFNATVWSWVDSVNLSEVIAAIFPCLVTHQEI